MIIQNDNQGKPLFSVGVECECQLTENSNGDICVAEKAGQAFVVVHGAGKLRFKYEGDVYSYLLSYFCLTLLMISTN